MLRLTSVKLNINGAPRSLHSTRLVDRTSYAQNSTNTQLSCKRYTEANAFEFFGRDRWSKFKTHKTLARSYFTASRRPVKFDMRDVTEVNFKAYDRYSSLSLAVDEHPFEVAFIIIITLLSYWGAYELYNTKHPDSGLYSTVAFVPFFTNLITLDLAEMSHYWIFVYLVPVGLLFAPPIGARPFLGSVFTSILSLYTTFRILKNNGFDTYFGLLTYSVRWMKPILYSQLNLISEFNNEENHEPQQKVSTLFDKSGKVMEAWDQILSEKPYNPEFVQQHLPNEFQLIENNPSAKIGLYAYNTGLQPPYYVKTYQWFCDMMTPIIPFTSQFLKWSEQFIYKDE